MSSPPQKPTSINPTTLKIRFAYRFLHSLNNLNSPKNIINPLKTSANENQIHRKSRRVKIAAYASMASVVGSRRAWSRAILSKIRNRIRNPSRKTRIKKRVDRKTTIRNPKRELSVDPFGCSGQEGKLRKLVPGAETMDACGLLDETADYIKCLATQVEVMRNLVDIYSTI